MSDLNVSFENDVVYENFGDECSKKMGLWKDSNLTTMENDRVILYRYLQLKMQSVPE